VYAQYIIVKKMIFMPFPIPEGATDLAEYTTKSLMGECWLIPVARSFRIFGRYVLALRNDPICIEK
jgi:hypothetical protein